MNGNAEQVAEAMDLLGAAYRGDWSDFDGRTLRAQLGDLSGALRSDVPFVARHWAAGHGICPVDRCWAEHCSDRGTDRHLGECQHISEALAEAMTP